MSSNNNAQDRVNGSTTESARSRLTQQLTSISSSRDLSLSAELRDIRASRSRKQFAPNLNVKRFRPQESTNGSCSQVTHKEKSGRNRKEPKSASAKSRRKPELIQTSGTAFSQGIGGPRKRSDYAGDSSSKSSSHFNSSSGNVRLPVYDGVKKIDKANDDRLLADLLQDNCMLNDDVNESEGDDGLCPVSLPLLNVSTKQPSAKLKIKSEPQERYGESSTEFKSQNIDSAIASVNHGYHEVPIDRLFSEPNHGPLLLQMPDCIQSVSSTEKQRVKSEKVNDLDVNIKSETPTVDCSDTTEGGGLASLGTGRLGSLQVMKSGRVYLIIAGTRFQLQAGAPVHFLQEAVLLTSSEADCTQSLSSASSQPPVTDVHVLSRVNHKVVCTPDWDTLIDDSHVARA